jgi:hypothetical protein
MPCCCLQLGYGYTPPTRRRYYKVEAGAAAASTRLYSPLLRRRRRLQMKQKKGLLIRMHRNFGDFYLDYDYFNRHEILH